MVVYRSSWGGAEESRGGEAKFTASMGAHKTNIMPLFAVVVKLEGAKWENMITSDV